MLVFGSLNVDLVVRAARFPAAGETVPALEFSTFPGGKGLNQAVAARRAGAAVAVVGRVGEDDLAATLRRHLDAEGVDASALRVDPAGTGVALIVVEPDGGNRILVVPRANGALGADDADAASGAIEGAGAVLLQGEVPLAASLRAARTAARVGVPVLFNPAPAPPPCAELEELLALAAFVLPNEGELAALAGPGERGALELRRRTGGPILATLGERGVLVAASPGGPVRLLPTFPVRAVDTVGAGDAFVGTLAAMLAEGRGLDPALDRALAAGALACTRPGALPAMPRREEIEALVASGRVGRAAGAPPP